MDDQTKQRLEAADARYMAASHAVQSGIAMMMNYDPAIVERKHLLVGIMSQKAEQMGLAMLLIAKGAFTLVEYHEAMADAAEAEKVLWEAKLAEHLGKQVTLA